MNDNKKPGEPLEPERWALNIPHIMSGRCIRINVPALLRQMDAVK